MNASDQLHTEHAESDLADINTLDASSVEQTSPAKGQWTDMQATENGVEPDLLTVQNFICKGFNTSGFFGHNQMTLRVEDGVIKGFITQAPHLIGNVTFQILHGGVAATMLDSIGGAFSMSEIYRRGETPWEDRAKKVARLATVDMRVDYIAPGRGKSYVATAEVLRMGRKGCTVRANMHCDQGKLIATAMISYAY